MSDAFIYSGNSIPPGGDVGQVLTKVGGPNYYTAWRTLDQSIVLSGDVTGTGTASILTTLTSTGVTAGTYNNSATSVSPFTVDIKGRITAVGSAVTITPSFSSITSKPTTLAGYGITDAPTTTGTGASGTWGINITGSAGSVAAANVTGLGTMATQDSNNVSITGGSIDGIVFDDGTF
jgi:hypothetical protein